MVTLALRLWRRDLPPNLEDSVRSYRAALGAALRRWVAVIATGDGCGGSSPDDAGADEALARTIAALDGVPGIVERRHDASGVAERALALAMNGDTPFAWFSDGDARLQPQPTGGDGGASQPPWVSSTASSSCAVATSWCVQRCDADGAHWWETVVLRYHRGGCTWRLNLDDPWNAYACRCAGGGTLDRIPALCIVADAGEAAAAITQTAPACGVRRLWLTSVATTVPGSHFARARAYHELHAWREAADAYRACAAAANDAGPDVRWYASYAADACALCSGAPTTLAIVERLTALAHQRPMRLEARYAAIRALLRSDAPHAAYAMGVDGVETALDSVLLLTPPSSTDVLVQTGLPARYVGDMVRLACWIGKYECAAAWATSAPPGVVDDADVAIARRLLSLKTTRRAPA